MSDIYLIWSHEHSGWWKPGGWGYSAGLRDAGKFTRKDAIEICRNALPMANHIGAIAEVPVRLDDMIEIIAGADNVPEVVITDKRDLEFKS